MSPDLNTYFTVILIERVREIIPDANAIIDNPHISHDLGVVRNGLPICIDNNYGKVG
jgi:hypothetical protein